MKSFPWPFLLSNTPIRAVQTISGLICKEDRSSIQHYPSKSRLKGVWKQIQDSKCIRPQLEATFLQPCMDGLSRVPRSVLKVIMYIQTLLGSDFFLCPKTNHSIFNVNKHSVYRNLQTPETGRILGKRSVLFLHKLTSRNRTNIEQIFRRQVSLLVNILLCVKLYIFPPLSTLISCYCWVSIKPHRSTVVTHRSTVGPLDPP